jgi:Ca2+-binding RTX toxin-like protein
LIGNSAENTLNGGLGSDSLTGGSGQDQFVFSTSLNSTTNVDTLLDFQTGTDSIVLSEAVFAQLADLDIGSSPSVDNLLIGDAALDANDYLLYNSSTGVLSYDADGSGTASAAVAFAKIELNGVPPTDLSATDFIISA